MHRPRDYSNRPIVLCIALAAGLLALTALTACGTADDSASTVVVVGLDATEPVREVAKGARRAAGEADSARVQLLRFGEPGELADSLEQRLQEQGADLVVAAGTESGELAASLASRFPETPFILFSAQPVEAGAANVRRAQFSRQQQGFVLGHLAAMVTASGAARTNPELRIGLLGTPDNPLAAVVEDSYRLGARSVHPDIRTDVAYATPNATGDAVYDAAHELLRGGVDVILACAGERNAQIVQAVRESHGYMLLADDTVSDSRGRGMVLASAIIDHARATENAVTAALTIPAPSSARRRLGFSGGYLEFRPRMPLYRRALPKDVREAQQELVERLGNGELTLDR